MIKLLSIVLLSLFTSIVFGQSDKNGDLWAKVEELNKAIFETKDSATIQELVAENVTYGHSTGLLEDKPIMLHNAVHSAESYANLSLQRLSTTPVGSTVVVRYILTADVTKGNDKYPLNIGIMQVWGKNKAKWMLFARQAVKIAPKPS